MLDKIIYYSFLLIFALVPFIWSSWTSELFEFNKMIATYLLTVIITGAWVLKMINQKALLIKRTPLDTPILLFLIANILSTIFSFDRHTSIWGYYSRLNGGLLSIMSYSLLYFAFVSNISKEQVFKILNGAIVSGVLISIWAIMEHFGVSLSCILLQGEFNANCWVQDVQARVFATMGQPNWLAAYLAMLIFPTIYFALIAEKKLYAIRYTLYSVILYLAFTFTYSRGGLLGFLAGLGTFIFLSFPRSRLWRTSPRAGRESNKQSLKGNISSELSRFPYKQLLYGSPIKSGMTIVLFFLTINLLFGSALTDFKLLQQFSPPPRPSIAQSGTQLENGGTESGQIRLIVWKGAVEVFKHYPILGTGVETFAYSYYRYRPVEHNLVSEWDFLYNKAHNEYLNYLANTGIVGFGTYMLMIGIFIFWCIKSTVIATMIYPTKQSPSRLEIASVRQGEPRNDVLLIISVLASYIAYLIQNIFGFSVVIIALFFFLFPAIAFVVTDSARELNLAKISRFPLSIINLIYHRPLYTKITKAFLLFFTCYLLILITNIWRADALYSIGDKLSIQGDVDQAFNYFIDASEINPSEPLYKSELGYTAAASALLYKDVDATISAQLKDQAEIETASALNTSPNNTSFWRTAFRTYLQLAELDSSNQQLTLDTIDYAMIIAPTDAKLPYHKGLVLDEFGQLEEATKSIQRAIDLKPNYREPYITLAQIQFKLAEKNKDETQKQQAVKTIKKVLEFIPNDPDVIEQLNKWGEQGVATQSGEMN